MLAKTNDTWCKIRGNSPEDDFHDRRGEKVHESGNRAPSTVFNVELVGRTCGDDRRRGDQCQQPDDEYDIQNTALPDEEVDQDLLNFCAFVRLCLFERNRNLGPVRVNIPNDVQGRVVAGRFLIFVRLRIDDVVFLRDSCRSVVISMTVNSLQDTAVNHRLFRSSSSTTHAPVDPSDNRRPHWNAYR